MGTCSLDFNSNSSMAVRTLAMLMFARFKSGISDSCADSSNIGQSMAASAPRSSGCTAYTPGVLAEAWALLTNSSWPVVPGNTGSPISVSSACPGMVPDTLARYCITSPSWALFHASSRKPSCSKP